LRCRFQGKKAKREQKEPFAGKRGGRRIRKGAKLVTFLKGKSGDPRLRCSKKKKKRLGVPLRGRERYPARALKECTALGARNLQKELREKEK